ncbi:hypothetical protein [Sulfuriferula sp.]|uniref:hypothetical protein n=1 Tax=Sulfuriferula sp. TaxID=2025307 RepID=UPI002731FF87|nr:hypothetical protein [Sulfuriferula sp.]MDP2027177.1 hypothetical protein [Sulfuriferula sp.]
MIIFDIESGRLDALAVHHVATPQQAISRPQLPQTALRLMSVAEAVWLEAAQGKHRYSLRG